MGEGSRIGSYMQLEGTPWRVETAVYNQCRWRHGGAWKVCTEERPEVRQMATRAALCSMESLHRQRHIEGHTPAFRDRSACKRREKHTCVCHGGAGLKATD